MNHSLPNRVVMLFVTLILLSTSIYAQGTKADYERAQNLRKQFEGAVVNVAGRATWIEGTHTFWYRRSSRGGNEFMLFNAETLAKTRIFDHDKLAAGLSSAAGEKYKPLELPFANFTFVNNANAIQFAVTDNTWRCDLGSYLCTRVERRGGLGFVSGQQNRTTDQPKPSPDGKWEAYIKNYNLFIRSKDKKEDVELSWDGSENNFYAFGSIAWSPDSKSIAAYRVRPGYHRKIQYIQSSPLDQLQPKYSTIEYAKPGDTLDIEQPVLFQLATKQAIVVDNSLFPNAYEISNPVWRKDSRAFTFEYNQRGHQVFRVVEVNATTGKARALLSEEAKTFFCYSGKKYRYDVQDGKEIDCLSERDGWNHLYLIDPETAKLRTRLRRVTGSYVGLRKLTNKRVRFGFAQAGCTGAKIRTSITIIELTSMVLV